MSRSFDKQYKQLMEYIIKVKSGQQCLIIGRNYVVMNRKYYDKLIKKIK